MKQGKNIQDEIVRIVNGKTIKRLECLRCHHVWWPKSTKLPKVCPKCKSVLWQIAPKVARPEPPFTLTLILRDDPTDRQREKAQEVVVRATAELKRILDTP